MKEEKPEYWGISYQTVTPVRSDDGFVAYVNTLREKFAIRIEVADRSILSVITGRVETTDFGKALKEYLNKQLPDSTYEIQHTNASSLHYVWFMQKDDALAFMLKWNGRIV